MVFQNNIISNYSVISLISSGKFSIKKCPLFSKILYLLFGRILIKLSKCLKGTTKSFSVDSYDISNQFSESIDLHAMENEK